MTSLAVPPTLPDWLARFANEGTQEESMHLAKFKRHNQSTQQRIYDLSGSPPTLPDWLARFANEGTQEESMHLAKFMHHNRSTQQRINDLSSSPPTLPDWLARIASYARRRGARRMITKYYN